jgi:REP element-mobilizing transposase RayT
MPRPLRICFRHALYRVTVRGVDGCLIYRSDDDYRRFLALLDDVAARCGWIVHGYCLLGDHFELLVETPHANISAGMQRLNGRYAQGFNRRHGRTGHLFGGRFKSLLLEKEVQLVEVLRAMLLAPVRAGFCRRPGGWPWSSFRALVGRARPPRFLHLDWVLARFTSRPQAQRAFRRYVESPLTVRPPPLGT